jgi:aspartyl-tRNA(Asn)/glutamyl-tRNA(Gln) amidotransferase subunit C
MISRETITYLCGLSKLELTEEEIVKYEQQIEEIIRYMDILDGLTLSDIQPVSAEKRLYQLREDNIQSFDSDPLSDPKKRKDSYVKGPRII